MVHQNELTQSDNISSFAREHVHKDNFKCSKLRQPPDLEPILI